jgi:hypothetical protein
MASNFQTRTSFSAPQQDGLIGATLPHSQISIFARSYEVSAPLVGMPVYAVAQIGVLPAPTPQPDGGGWANLPRSIVQTEAFVYYPLGLLGTNHAGYASFDLTVLRGAELIDAFRLKQIELGVDAAYKDERQSIGLRHLWVFPFADPTLAIDALGSGELGPQFIVLRMELDASQLAGREMDRPMVAMQNPNILDWRLSPGSFTLSGSVLVGEDGCETLLPSNLSTQQFRFRQVARRTGMTARAQPETEIRAGYVVEYTTEWFSVGHSLGQLIYSLPLAPGEVVKLAIVDWSRSDTATRTEDTGFSESLTHDQLRDRSLTESVHAVLTEVQQGHSFMAGAALSVAGAYGGIAAGLTGAIGGGSSTSEGTRDLSAQTTQHISDAFHQASTAMRELRSTVVVQSTQSEKSDLKTRVVANYNHSHALTMLYYEVLRHYRVVTRVASSRPALLVDYGSISDALANVDNIVLNRKVLESMVLDDRIVGCFDAAVRARCDQAKRDRAIQQAPQQPPNADANLLFPKFYLNFKTGSPERENAPMHVNLLRTDGGEVRLIMVNGGMSSDSSYLHNPNDRNFTKTKHDVFEVVPEVPPAARWGDIFGFRVFLSGGSDALAIDQFYVDGMLADGTFRHLCDVGLFEIGTGNDTLQPAHVVSVQTPPAAQATPLPPGPSDDDLCCVDRLVKHFDGHRAYYNRVLWLSEDSNARAVRLDGLRLNGRPLLDLIENRALEVSGNYVAFPVNASAERSVNALFNPDDLPEPEPDDEFIEQLLTLPTRGIFGEAKLGHCNSSEIIDPTRFWDWQKSPIQFAPADITGIDGGTRAKAPEGLTPTAFPQSLVNIVNPGALPDPAGLAGALKVLGTPAIFRDQSGMQETGTMLGKLSDNATSLAGKALEGQNRRGLIDDINASDLSDDQKTNLIGKLLTGQVEQQNKTAISPTGTGTATGGGTGTGSSGNTAAGNSGLGGSSTLPPAPVPAPLPTGTAPPPVAPKPQSNKPPLANPIPTTGLEFRVKFMSVQGGVVTGTARVYLKNVVSGAGFETANLLIGVGNLVTFSTRANESSDQGGLTIFAQYQLNPWADTLAEAVANQGTGLAVTPAIATLNGPGHYKKPAVGNEIWLTAVPVVAPIEITATSARAAMDQVAGSFGVDAKPLLPLSATITGTTSVTNTTGQAVKWTVQALTGGMTITQDPQ